MYSLPAVSVHVPVIVPAALSAFFERRISLLSSKFSSSSIALLSFEVNSAEYNVVLVISSSFEVIETEDLPEASSV